MDDTTACPICGNKMRTNHLENKLLHPVGKIADYAERACVSNYNHVIMLWTDKTTKKIDLIKISLNKQSSRFIEIDYINQKCRITCAKEGEYDYIEIPKMIEPDFPSLTNLKERVSMYITFS
jgi:hypothetical protein